LQAIPPSRGAQGLAMAWKVLKIIDPHDGWGCWTIAGKAAISAVPVEIKL